MTRILHAVTWKSMEKYTQGLNVLLAPFLLCMNEVDAFHSYYRLYVEMVPTYWMKPRDNNPQGFKSYLGVNAACRIADKILRHVDPKLHKALMKNYSDKNKKMKPTERWFHTLYTHRHMQTLSLCTKPLEQVVLMLDVIFAMGIQYHVLIYVAQLMSLREKLMQKGTKLEKFIDQKSFPEVNARYVISTVSYLIDRLKENHPTLLDELKRHTTDRQLCERLIRWEEDPPANVNGGGATVVNVPRKNSRREEMKTDGERSGNQKTSSEPEQLLDDSTSKDDGRQQVSEDTGSTTLVVGILLFAVVGIFLVALAVVYNNNL